MNELPANTVWRENGEWYCDPRVVAGYLGVSPEAFRAGLRNGTITGTVECGEGDDAGRTRLTYRYLELAWSICVEPDGRIHEVAPPVSQRGALDWLVGRSSRLLRRPNHHRPEGTGWDRDE